MEEWDSSCTTTGSFSSATGIRKMSLKTEDTPIGELVGDVEHLGYEISHFEGIWSNAA